MATTGKGNIKQLSKELDTFSEKIKKLYGELGKLEKNTREYAKKQRELNKVQKEAGKIHSELGKKQKALNQNNKNHKKSIDRAQKAQKKYTDTLYKTTQQTGRAAKSQRTYSQRLKTAVGTLARYSVAYKLLAVGQRLFKALTTDAIKESIKFEKSVANLGAIAGVSGKELENLSNNALKVAGSTKFSADEIIGLQTELSKLGFTSEDVIKSTQDIAFAAQALGSPLNSTAALIGKIRNQFNLLVEETSVTADTLVTAINNSALSFDSFGTAIQYIGPIAQNLGLTFQQTTGAMAALSDAGFTASRVGTGLRGIFTELGKVSPDVEKSLKSLAEQNISLSEAVDLVGKRNAAQLITLLKNIDALDEGNDKYYEQGRALNSAAQQADTFSGQMEILTSNFKEFQIAIGETITESDLLLGVLDAFFPKGAKTARAFKAINDIGFETFNEGAENVSKGADATSEALRLLGIDTDEYKKTLENAVVSKGWEFLTSINPGKLADTRDEAIATKNSVEGLVEQLNQLAETTKKNKLILDGQTLATNDYGDAVEDLLNKSIAGINVNAEADKMYKNLGANISSYQAKLISANGVTEDQRIQYKAAIKVLQGYQDQVKNTIVSEEDLETHRKKKIKAEKSRLKEEIDAIKDNTQETVDFLNERAKVETAIAETAEQRAEIEAERAKLVSNAYLEQADQIGALSVIYSDNKKIILDSVKASEKLAAVLGSDVIADVNKAYSEYSDELTSLQDALENGKISQDDYERSVAMLRTRLEDTISTFKEMFGTSPEMEQFFDNVIMNFDALAVGLDEVEKKTDKTAETLKEFFEDFKEGGYLEYVEQLFSSIGKGLDEFNNTATENTKNELDSQLDAINNRYEVEQDILKSQLDNQLITESQYRQKQLEIRKAQLAEENTIDKKIFEAEKKQDVNDAKIEGLVSAAKTVVKALEKYGPTPAGAIAATLGASIVAGQVGAQISAINQRKFFPKKYAEGGMVNGPSHEQGGVPFTVQGQGGFEMEGGEYIINKRATAMHRALLDRINNSTKTRPTIGKMKFADGGLVKSSPVNESVDYLKAIAEATTSTAINSNKPVRAFVADKDLRSNATERRLRDRNDRI